MSINHPWALSKNPEQTTEGSKERTMAEKTFEEVLNETYKIDNQEITPDFRVAIQAKRTDGVHIIVHPMNTSGTTLDLLVKGNVISNPFDKPLDPSEGK